MPNHTMHPLNEKNLLESGRGRPTLGAWLTRAAATTALGLLAAPAAQAVDGVHELSQICAETTGCGPTDAPGFPITIDAAGSYRLTGNLAVPDTNTTAIEVRSHDVTLDLGGFRIGPREDCRPDCGVSGSGSAIDATGQENLTVRNGTVVGMGRSAVRAGDAARIEDLRAHGQGGSAIVLGDHSSVTAATIDGAGGVGVAVGSNGAVTDCLIRNAQDDGLRGGSATRVAGNRIQGNGGDGIEIRGRRAGIQDNLITGNVGSGIYAADGVIAGNAIALNQSFGVFLLGGDGGVVRDNHVSENGSGIDVASTSSTMVVNNAVAGNVSNDLNVSGDAGTGGNVLDGVGSAPAGQQMSANVCGSALCP